MIDRIEIECGYSYADNPDNVMHSMYQMRCNWCFAYFVVFIIVTYFIMTLNLHAYVNAFLWYSLACIGAILESRLLRQELNFVLSLKEQYGK